MSYTAIVLKVPQNVTLVEWLMAAEYAYQYRHTMTASHDDMTTILKGGGSNSYVKVAFPSRQADTIALVESMGFAWVPVLADPLNGIEFGPLFEFKYRLTDPFNAPRDYANGLHEGCDYDILGGEADNKVSVLCLYDGIVESISSATTGYGRSVRVRHRYKGVPFFTRYGHLDSIAVYNGRSIQKGERVGEVGSTGNSPAEHVHVNIEIPGYGLSGYVVPDVIDPAPFIPSGSNLPLYAPTIDTRPVWNMAEFLWGDGRPHTLEYNDGHGGLHRQVLYTKNVGKYRLQVKNEEYEQFWPDDGRNVILRGIDTSPGPHPDNGRPRYYIQREDQLTYGAPWSPARWRVGDTYRRNPLVTFYYKDNCTTIPNSSGYHATSLKFHALYDTWTSPGGVTLKQVAELHWIVPGISGPAETYFYARLSLSQPGGLVGWKSSSGAHSYIVPNGADTEIQDIESIPCLNPFPPL